MNPVLRNILAVIAGILIGGFLNSKIIGLSGQFIPLPEGVDPMDPESLAAGMHLFETKHFIIPFLAHALGTLAGAFIAAKLAVSRKFSMAMIIGGVFLIGGISMIFLVPSPILFTIVDLGLAYFPMAWLGAMIAGANRKAT